MKLGHFIGNLPEKNTTLLVRKCYLALCRAAVLPLESRDSFSSDEFFHTRYACAFRLFTEFWPRKHVCFRRRFTAGRCGRATDSHRQTNDKNDANNTSDKNRHTQNSPHPAFLIGKIRTNIQKNVRDSRFSGNVLRRLCLLHLTVCPIKP